MQAIVAVYSDWGIGAKGTQPLVIPADRKRFRALTDGAAVIVGRKTMEDFPGGRPLKGRHNIVINIDGEALYKKHINFTLVPGGVNFFTPKGLKFFEQ